MRDGTALYNNLTRLGFISGSRAFGTERPRSDLDLVVSGFRREEAINLLKRAPRVTVYPSTYFGGSKFVWLSSLENQAMCINLIPVHPSAFRAWYLATIAMASTCKAARFQDPEDKYGVFEAMVAAFKLTTHKQTTGELLNDHDKESIQDAKNNPILQPAYATLKQWTLSIESLAQPDA